MKLLVVGPRGKMGRLITAIAADREASLLSVVSLLLIEITSARTSEKLAMIGRVLGTPVVSDIES